MLISEHKSVGLRVTLPKGLHQQKRQGSESPAQRRADQPSPGPRGKTVRVELEWEIPMSVTLPLQMEPDPAHQPFPFLDTTLADLGIQESDVKERVVWVDTKKTQVKNKAGKLKEKEITILEVRVKAQKPGDKQLQEVLYSTESHTDRSFCRTGMNILPWKHRGTGLSEVQPDLTDAQEHREI
uniref:Si:ch211-196f5.2 n=1 Tax=Cyclopterus lumpus TaxID=8103 RepID=A0A8C2XHK4_CYCLU